MARWLRLPQASSMPYSPEHLHDSHDYMARTVLCHQRSPSVARFGWSEDGRETPRLETADELCTRLGDSSLIFIGDSLSLQIFDSFRARLRQRAFAGGFQAAWKECMSKQPNPCEGEASAELCDGLCTGGVTHQQSANYARCTRGGGGSGGGGGSVYMAQAYRWVMSADHFESSDPVRGAHCAEKIRHEPRAFGLFVVPPAHLHKMVREVARQATRTRHGQAGRGHNRSTSVTLVINQFAHIHNFLGSVALCYNASGMGGERRQPSLGNDLVSVATRDVLRYWALDQARWALTLRNLQRNLSSHPSKPIELRVFYRTSAPACDAFCVSPQGAPRRPVAMSELLDKATDAGASQYSHHLVFGINDVSRAAFRAHGHGVIDLEGMLGTRVDAHPGSYDGVGDKLHCKAGAFSSDATPLSPCPLLVQRDGCCLSESSLARSLARPRPPPLCLCAQSVSLGRPTGRSMRSFVAPIRGIPPWATPKEVCWFHSFFLTGILLCVQRLRETRSHFAYMFAATRQPRKTQIRNLRRRNHALSRCDVIWSISPASAVRQGGHRMQHR